MVPHRFVNVLVYYGLSLGVSRLGTDLYLTQFIFGLVEIPARTLVLFVLPYSRRLCQSGFLATGGLSCLLMLAIPAGTQVSVIIEMYKAGTGFQTSWRCAVVSGARMLRGGGLKFCKFGGGALRFGCSEEGCSRGRGHDLLRDGRPYALRSERKVKGSVKGSSYNQHPSPCRCVQGPDGPRHGGEVWDIGFLCRDLRIHC